MIETDFSHWGDGEVLFPPPSLEALEHACLINQLSGYAVYLVIYIFYKLIFMTPSVMQLSSYLPLLIKPQCKQFHVVKCWNIFHCFTPKYLQHLTAERIAERERELFIMLLLTGQFKPLSSLRRSGCVHVVWLHQWFIKLQCFIKLWHSVALKLLSEARDAFLLLLYQ